jgi:hypothetical protein
MAMAKKNTEQEKAPFSSQLGLKFKEETGNVLSWKLGFVRC